MLCKPLTNIINAVFRTGQCPNMWKRAEMTPLNKVKSLTTYKDRRPISLLFHLRKITKKSCNIFQNLTTNMLEDLTGSGSDPVFSLAERLWAYDNKQ